jgi:TupA-like ATPgrasp
LKISNALLVLIYKLPSGLSRRALFVYRFHKWPNFKNPTTFNEKINWRILNDRRPLLEWTCDKLAMKDHVAGVQSALDLGLRIPHTLWSGTDIQELESVDLPEHWVLKPNHRSGLVYFGHGRPDIPALRKVTKRWNYRFEGHDLHEWAYLKARPMLVAEELLGTPGTSLTDYKFYVFAGEVAEIQVDVDRHAAHRCRYYRPDWHPVDAAPGVQPASRPEPSAPATLKTMLAVASVLGRPFDFMRVDLYSVGGETFFGELTPYSGSGIEAMEPACADNELGSKWKLPNVR